MLKKLSIMYKYTMYLYTDAKNIKKNKNEID